MGVIKNYLIPRICVYFLVIFAGSTLCFFIPRFTPLDPVRSVLTRFEQYGQYYDPESFAKLSEALTELYGLKGSLLDQYIAFLGRLSKGDFGLSLAFFPTPVIELIENSIPWTITLLLTSTIISWVMGNIIGGITGYFSDKKWARILSGFSIIIYPLPYYIIALVLIMTFLYLFPWWPLTGGCSIGIKPSFTFSFFIDAIQHAFLPALSLVLAGYGWWFLTMSSLSINTKSEDYVIFGEIAGIDKKTLISQYVVRNSLLPQITGLSVTLGTIFEGALITEVAFSYPGVGFLFRTAIVNGDFNLMMGLVIYSVIGVATATLLIDLLYPLIDPRIKYR